MADKTFSAEQQTTNTGGDNSVDGVVGFRDLNSSIGGLDISNLAAATSSATSGAVTVGDRIFGGEKSTNQFGLVKILVVCAGIAILYKIFKSKGGK